MPASFRDLIAVTKGDPDDFCTWLAMDGATTNCGRSPLPTNLAVHYDGKNQKKEQNANLYWTSLVGKIVLSNHHAPGSHVDVEHLRQTSIFRRPQDYLRNTHRGDSVSDAILTDGIFVSVGGNPDFSLDHHLILPPRQPFGPGDSEIYENHRYYRTVVENAPYVFR